MPPAALLPGLTTGATRAGSAATTSGQRCYMQHAALLPVVPRGKSPEIGAGRSAWHPKTGAKCGGGLRCGQGGVRSRLEMGADGAGCR
jgi:hypothetical protein